MARIRLLAFQPNLPFALLPSNLEPTLLFALLPSSQLEAAAAAAAEVVVSCVFFRPY
jgi:hypothetical protein